MSVPTISADTAQALGAATAARAQGLGHRIAIAVCDPGRELKASRRREGAALLVAAIAQNKAYSAVSFGISTGAWHDFIKDDPPLRDGIVHTLRLTVFGGGYPIKENSQVIVVIRVSGGHYTNDMDCARGGLEALGLGTN